MRIKRQAGVSMLEVIITLSIMSIVSVASVWLVFTTLSLRDLVLATTATSESLRVLSWTLSRAIRGASVVSGSATSLLITSADECWSFVYDSDLKNLRYAKMMAAGCAPNPSPSELFFPSYSQITNFSFLVAPLPTGGRQVTASGVMNTILPFENYQTSFGDTFTNVVD
ncbi:MAG: prepilin-type N-terminal cleavage/methylation domain-containing protein [Microgenomates group bacterium]